MTDPDAELRAWAPVRDEQAEEMRLPGYRDFRRVAEGGEGVVYRARQDGLDRFVAVKVLNVDDPARLARFRRELEITVRLGRQHPHIVTVLDTGTAPGGRPCIVMEYYDLGSLADRLRERGPLPVAEVVAAGGAVADALAFAHGQGFLHRDVKPQNILVLPTSYVLADFGIARTADSARTSSLHLVSYRHAAPQMIDGDEPSPADDLWSLGSTLFTLLDGAPPFAAERPGEDTVLSYLERVRSAEPRTVRRAGVPPALAAVLARCLSKRREDRFPDASALRAALAAVSTGIVDTAGTATTATTTTATGTTNAGIRTNETTTTATAPATATTTIGTTTGTAAGTTETAAETTETGNETTTTATTATTNTGTTATTGAAGWAPPLAPSVPFGDFGDFGPLPPPPPAPQPPPAPPAPPEPAGGDADRTALGPGSALAGLTVRLPDDPAPPDFGPESPYAPTDLPPVAELPVSPWPTVPATPEQPDEQRPRRGRKLLFAVLAVLAGGGIGAAATLLGGTGNPTADRAPPSSSAAPAPTSVPGGDPAFAPTLDSVADDGDRITLTWTDPTGGDAQFVVVDVTRSPQQALVTVPAGNTSHTVTGLDPDAGRYCFQIVAIGLTDIERRGASKPACTNR